MLPDLIQARVMSRIVRMAIVIRRRDGIGLDVNAQLFPFTLYCQALRRDI